MRAIKIKSQFDMIDFVSLARRTGTDTQKVEVKSAEQQLPKDVVETLSSFSNASGGILILGLSERDGFRPIRNFDAKRMSDALAQCCNDKLEPPVRADIEIVPFEGCFLVVAEIPELAPYQKPCYVKARSLYEGSFVRTWDGDRRLSRYEVDRILEEHRQPRFDEEAVLEASLSDLDTELVEGFLAKEKENSARFFSMLSKDEALLAMKVIAKGTDGALHPTIAGLLALGIYPQQFFPRLNVTFAAYPGTSKGEIGDGGIRFLDSKTITGSIPIMIAEALAALRRNMKTVSYMVGALRRDAFEYPEEAAREALANALMHRDYSPEGCGSQVQVNMYADRIEVLNAGGLYGAVTVDQLGKLGVSASRNARLSRILESTPYPIGCAESGYVVENKGTGYAIIRNALEQAGMDAPETTDTISAFAFTMRKRTWRYAEKESDEIDWTLSRTDRKIIDWLKDVEVVKAVEVAEVVGVSRSTASRRLKVLCDRGLVERLGSVNSPQLRYRLSKNV